MRGWLEIGLTALVLIGGVGWCASNEAAARAQGRAELLEERRDSLVAEAVADSIRVAELDAAAAEAVQRHATSRDSLQRVIARARTRRDTVLVEIVQTENVDTLRALVVELTESHEQETAALRSALAEADIVIRAQTAQVVARDALISDLRASLATAIAAGDERRRAASGFGFRIRTGLLPFVAGAAVGALAAAAAGG